MIPMLPRRIGARLGIVALMLLGVACGSGESKTSGISEAPGQAGATFNVNVSRPQGGTIASVVAGVADGKINCGTKGGTANGCAEVSYPWSQVVTFTATPDAGFKFTGWAADCSGTGPCSVDTTQRGADKWIAAVFEPVTWYPGVYFLVEVTRPTGGTVTSDDGRIRCGTATNANVCGPLLYQWSDSVTLSAVADAGHGFDGWTGDCSGATCTLSTTPNGTDKAVSATFSARPPIACSVENGTGERTWNGSEYGACTVVSCNPNYWAFGSACVNPALSCGDLAEYDVLQRWSYYAEPGPGFTTTLVELTGSGVYRGVNAIRAQTTAAFDFAMIYQPPAPLDVSGFEQLRFAVRALNTNVLNGETWQGAYPKVILRDTHGGLRWYAPTTNFAPRDGQTWVPLDIPLSGSATWVTGGSVDPHAISAIEIHFDTWEWNPLVIDIDALRFAHPAEVCTTVFAGDAAGWSEAVGGTFILEDFSDTTLTPGLSVAATSPSSGIGDGVFHDQVQPESWGQTYTTTWSFSAPVYGFGATFDTTPGGAGSGISVSINGAWVKVGEVPNTYTKQFWGFVSAVPFTELRFESGTQAAGARETFDMDDLVYSPR